MRRVALIAKRNAAGVVSAHLVEHLALGVAVEGVVDLHRVQVLASTRRACRRPPGPLGRRDPSTPCTNSRSRRPTATGRRSSRVLLGDARTHAVSCHHDHDLAHRCEHPVLQGGAALLEGRLPDRRRAGADGGAVPADLRPRARRPRAGLPRRALHQLPDSGAGDDERAAERVRQQQLVADPEQDHRQPGVPAGHAAVALGLVRGLCRRVGGARAGGRRWACSRSRCGSRRRAGAAVVDRRLRACSAPA